MLLHNDSNMYLKINNEKAAKVNKTCKMVNVSENGDNAVFTLKSTVRYKNPGEHIE